ncbi:hypothetical protein DFJ73DRAFT_815128 [Zopfochytrium polystomum]|nr:hypothetical protein DFJ73DRAFT_815128 [Zopfochytrium polystomum]
MVSTATSTTTITVSTTTTSAREILPMNAPKPQRPSRGLPALLPTPRPPPPPLPLPIPLRSWPTFSSKKPIVPSSTNTIPTTCTERITPTTTAKKSMKNKKKKRRTRKSTPSGRRLNPIWNPTEIPVASMRMTRTRTIWASWTTTIRNQA